MVSFPPFLRVRPVAQTSLPCIDAPMGHDSFIWDEPLDGGRDISICDSLVYLVAQTSPPCIDAPMGHDSFICDTQH